MRKMFRRYIFVVAPCLGFILLIPFITLEIVNRWKFNEGFPYAVFTFTWLLQTLFIWIIISVISQLSAGKSAIKHPAIFLLRVAGLVLITYIWSGWIVDQWPCLMGVPNCD